MRPPMLPRPTRPIRASDMDPPVVVITIPTRWPGQDRPRRGAHEGVGLVASGKDQATGRGGAEGGRSESGKGDRPRVGLIGVGRMGTPMAARLVAGGFTVTAFDLSPAAR